MHHHPHCVSPNQRCIGMLSDSKVVLFPNQFVSRSEIHVTPWMTANDVFTVAVLNKLCQQLFLYCHTKIRRISDERFRFPVRLSILVSYRYSTEREKSSLEKDLPQPHHYSLLLRRYKKQPCRIEVRTTHNSFVFSPCDREN